MMNISAGYNNESWVSLPVLYTGSHNRRIQLVVLLDVAQPNKESLAGDCGSALWLSFHW